MANEKCMLNGHKNQFQQNVYLGHLFLCNFICKHDYVVSKLFKRNNPKKIYHDKNNYNIKKKFVSDQKNVCNSW